MMRGYTGISMELAKVGNKKAGCVTIVIKQTGVL